MAMFKRDLYPDELFLYCLAAYVLLLLNQHFNIPLKFLPFILLVAGTAVYVATSRKPLQGFVREAGLLQRELTAAAVLVLTLLLTTVAAEQSPRELLTTVIGPAALAALAGLVLSPRHAPRVLAVAGAAGLLFLAATDLLHYARDYWRTGELAEGPSHRWFADGYVFFLPWLLLSRDGASTRAARWSWQIGLIAVFFLLAGTGSRAAWLATATQIVLMGVLLRRPRYILDLCLLVAVLVLASPVFKPTAAAFARGFDDNQRVAG